MLMKLSSQRPAQCGVSIKHFFWMMLWLVVIAYYSVQLQRQRRPCSPAVSEVTLLSIMETPEPKNFSSSLSNQVGVMQSNIVATSFPRFLSNCTQFSDGETRDSAHTHMADPDVDFDIEYPVRPAFRAAMRRYITLHRKILARDPSVPHRFLIANPDGQLCNRIRGTAAAFTLALLTDRAFLVPNFGYGQTSYSDLFLPPGFDIASPEAAASAGDGPSITTSGSNDAVAEEFTCKDWPGRGDRVLKLNGAAYIVTYLMRNPHLQRRAQELFLDDDVYRPILHWLFRPRPELLEARDAFIRDNLPDPFLITFHIRTNFPVSPAEFAAYRACALAVTPPGSRPALPASDSTTASNTTRDATNYSGGDDWARASPRWFVATDGPAARQAVLAQLSAGAVFYSPTAFEVGSRLAGLRQAMVDILIAAAGDHIFLTPFSSYSRVIALYARTPHIYVVSDWGLPEADPHRTLTRIGPGEHCYRFLSKEDCMWVGHRTTVGEVLRHVTCYTPAMIPDYC